MHARPNNREVGRRLIAILGCLSAACVGCSGSGDQGVSGSVRYQGQPVAEGVIQFYTPGDSPAPVAGAAIRNGSYEVPATQGLPAGAYLVRITSRRWVASNAGEQYNPFRSEETIPEKYNAQSILRIELGPRNRHKLKFDLE